MNHGLAVQTRSERSHKALTYTNPEIVHRIAHDNGVSNNEAKAIFQDTLRFLVLCGAWSGALRPTARIDIGWHAFLIFTREYRQYCQEHFGHFIDHVPTPKLTVTDNSSRKESAHNTLAGARALFASDIADAWAHEFGVNSSDCAPEPSCDSGSCCHDGNPG